MNESVTESPLDALVRSQVESLAGSDTSDSKEDLIKDEVSFYLSAFICQ